MRQRLKEKARTKKRVDSRIGYLYKDLNISRNCVFLLLQFPARSVFIPVVAVVVPTLDVKKERILGMSMNTDNLMFHWPAASLFWLSVRK